MIAPLSRHDHNNLVLLPKPQPLGAGVNLEEEGGVLPAAELLLPLPPSRLHSLREESVFKRSPTTAGGKEPFRSFKCGLSKNSPVRLATSVSQQVDSKRGTEGVHVPMGTISASSRFKADRFRSSSGSRSLCYTGPRSDQLTRERCDSPGEKHHSRVLFAPIYSPKEDGRLEASPRSVSVESLSKKDKIQDGFGKEYPLGYPTRRLGYQCGSEGRVLPRSYPSDQAPIPQVCVEGPSLPIPGAAIRTFSGPLYLHEDIFRVGSNPESAGDSLQDLPGRLAKSRLYGGSVPVGCQPNSRSIERSRLQHQPQEVRSHSIPSLRLSRSEIRHKNIHLQSHRSKSFGSSRLHSRITVPTGCFTQTMSTHPRDHGIDGHSATSSALLQEAFSTRGTREVRRFVESRRTHSSWPMVDSYFQTVAGLSLDSFQRSNSPSSASSVSVHRCVEEGLGSSLPTRCRFGLVAPSLSRPAHQLPRVDGGLVGSGSLPVPTSRALGHSCLGQLRVSGLHTKSGRDTLSFAVPSGRKASDLDSRQIDHLDNRIHTRQVERCGGSTEPKRPDSPNRMDYSPQCSTSSVGDMGKAAHRSLCDRVQHAPSPLHFSSQGSSGVRQECVLPLLGRDVGLCLPSNIPHSESGGKIQDRSSISDPHHARMAHSTLVLGAHASQSRASQTIESQSQNSPSTQDRGRTSKRGHPCPDRMETMRSGLRSQGLSSRVIDDILISRRPGTISVYKTRWSLWFDYCRKQKIDSIHPSVANFANFLYMLHKEKKLSYVTIAGYKSAIVHTISLYRGVSQPSFASSVVITNLMDSFKRQAPSRFIRLPRWDLFLVLSFLRDKYEPLIGLSLQSLTFKTVFLLTLALADRISGIHAISGLSHDIEFDDSGVTLHYVPEFRAKSRPSNVPHTPFRVPRLTNILNPDDDDFRLCPVRCLKEYLKRTSVHRRGQRRLFVSVNVKYLSDIRKTTISRWLIQTVKNAYLHAGKNLPSDPIKAHEIRAVSTSLALAKGSTVQSILKAAAWKNVSTFIDFYLRDINMRRTDNTLGIKSLVLAREALDI